MFIVAKLKHNSAENLHAEEYFKIKFCIRKSIWQAFINV